jgi:CheY-like chemotaxis protein
MATILIVDDEPLIRRSLVLLLTGRGHQPQAAGTVAEAIELASRIHPQLVIVDCMLGDRMDGVQLIEALRAETPALPALVVTGYASPELNARILATSDICVLQKPCPTNELLRAIDHVLAR